MLALLSKQLELLHELVPQAAVVGILLKSEQPQFRLRGIVRHTERGGAMGVQLAVPQASTESGIEAAFATLVQQRVGAVFIQRN